LSRAGGLKRRNTVLGVRQACARQPRKEKSPDRDRSCPAGAPGEGVVLRDAVPAQLCHGPGGMQVAEPHGGVAPRS